MTARYLYACHRNPGPFNVRIRAPGGSWSDELVPPANRAPFGIDSIQDGTLWLAMQSFVSPYEVYRKLPTGSWANLATRSVSFNSISALSQTECWFADGHILLDRYIHGSGFTTWNIEALMSPQPTVVEFRQSLIHAFASNDVIAVGFDQGYGRWHVAHYDGVSWNFQTTTVMPAAAGLLGALHVVGNNFYVAIGDFNFGSRKYLYKHTNKGIGGGWTEIGASGTGWPGNVSVPNGVWVNPNDTNEIWVCFGRPSANGPDIARTTDGGANWTTYTRGESTYGCASIAGDETTGEVWIGYNQSGSVVYWNGSSFGTDEVSGAGGFTGYWWGPGQDQAYQRLHLGPPPISLDIITPPSVQYNNPVLQTNEESPIVLLTKVTEQDPEFPGY